MLGTSEGILSPYQEDSKHIHGIINDMHQEYIDNQNLIKTISYGWSGIFYTIQRKKGYKYFYMHGIIWLHQS